MPNVGDLIASSLKGILGGASDIIKDFKADPTKVLEADQKLKELENSLEETKLKLASDIEQAYLKDDQNARDSNVSLQVSEKVPLFTKIVPYAIASFLALIWGFLTVYIVITYLGFIRKEVGINMEGIMGMYATVTGTFAIVLNFFFGNTANAVKQGDRKQAMIEGMVNK